MGPLRETKKVHRGQHHEKEISRSRIPRLILRPHMPQQQQKVSPASESPFSEEESREFNPSSSGRSARTISSNSFCSDDTGCPSSQSVSPVKTPSDAGNSPVSFCPGSDEDFTKKKFNIGMVVEGNTQSSRYKKEPKTCLTKPGSEADFSSSGSTGSISAPEVHMSSSTAGNKRASFPRNRGPHGRNNGSSSYKSVNSPPSREKDLLSMLCRNQQSPVNVHPNYGPSSPSSSNSGSYKGSDSSPVMRRPGRYMSCGENHGVKPPNPEQYLTPLQQKEVTVRHLKTKLKESESRLQERETEIAELKSQLARMREDWIEEECHRVEAQLALKEARKEIKQLKQVIETMRSSLADKDKGIQKYFADINIQNKKLESLLQSMEMAQNGSLRDEQCLDYLCDTPEKSLPPSTAYGKMADAQVLEDQTIEEGAESELLAIESLEDSTDLFEEIMMATTTEAGDLSLLQSTSISSPLKTKAFETAPVSQGECSVVTEQAIQTDVVPYSPDVEQLIQNMLKLQDPHPSSPSSLDESEADLRESFPEATSALMVDLTASDPNSAILLSPMETPYSKMEVGSHESRVMRELDFMAYPEERFGNVIHLSQAGIVKQYWSNSFLVDLLAVAAPIIPTVMWAFSTQRGGIDPVYNIGALLRGCCLVALHSLRRTPFHIQT
ncbi:syntabulin isoform X2 [Vombatus ursinus]|uniref:Syntabulin n=1 Tax=Vombatus ursinus TaxID=29139 RepID=A0A4X2LMA9_VOMUR|nr:syntabulin isoform X2 [Vombatus ursinus]XP_027709837.1 syntabulin isoform X2 [Vombatus ursinus]XP_027709838.1 syntabulin isoform X2 [Vombatus ursinus]